MPQVTVYIREGDLEKWKSLEKKSEFIHEALNLRWRDTTEDIGVSSNGKTPASKPDNVGSTPSAPAKLMNRFPGDEAVEVTLKDIKRSVGLCKHGADPKFCKFAKNGKPCK